MSQNQSGPPAENEEEVIPHINSTFKQQTMLAWRPFLTPCSSAIALGILSAVCLLCGLLYVLANDDLIDLEFEYDDDQTSLDIDIKKDIDAPFYIYYQIDGLYQNNFMYSDSINWDQLEGDVVKTGDLGSCKPLKYSDGDTMVPCGVLPSSVFNDTFVFNGFPQITHDGISIKSYRKLVKNPAKDYPDAFYWLDEQPKKDLFPEGQRSERFVNWISVATFNKFRKLWAKSVDDTPIKAGKYKVDITNEFPVSPFDGKKYIIISQTSWAGGQNKFLGWFFIVLCIVSGITAIALAILYYLNIFPLYKAISAGSILDQMSDH